MPTSRIVGVPGNSGHRFSAVTASAFSFPSLIWESSTDLLLKTISM